MINFTALPESKGHVLPIAKVRNPRGGFNTAISPEYTKEDLVTVMELKSGEVIK